MRLTRNAGNSIPGTAWYTCQQPGLQGGEGPPPRSTGKATESQVAIWGPAPDRGEEVEPGLWLQRWWVPLTPTHTHTISPQPEVASAGPASCPGDMASTPAWGSGHNTSVRWQNSLARNSSFSVATLGHEVWQHRHCVSGPESPETSPSPPGRAGRAPQVNTHRARHARDTCVSLQAGTCMSGASSEPRQVWVT